MTPRGVPLLSPIGDTPIYPQCWKGRSSLPTLRAVPASHPRRSPFTPFFCFLVFFVPLRGGAVGGIYCEGSIWVIG